MPLHQPEDLLGFLAQHHESCAYSAYKAIVEVCGVAQYNEESDSQSFNRFNEIYNGKDTGRFQQYLLNTAYWQFSTTPADKDREGYKLFQTFVRYSIHKHPLALPTYEMMARKLRVMNEDITGEGDAQRIWLDLIKTIKEERTAEEIRPAEQKNEIVTAQRSGSVVS